MKLEQLHDPNTRETLYTLTITDDEAHGATIPEDVKDRLISTLRPEAPIHVKLGALMVIASFVADYNKNRWLELSTTTDPSTPS